MATFIRIRRLHRYPLRIGKVNVTNTFDGTLVDLDDVNVNADLRRMASRWVTVDNGEFPRQAAATPPVGVQANIPPSRVITDIAASTVWSASAGGFERIFAVELPAGFKISTLKFTSGATAAGTPTHQWATIATGTATTLTYVAVSADRTSTAWLANAVQTFTLGTAYTTATAGTYFFTVMVLATTAPSLVGRTLASTAVSNLAVASPLTKASGTSSTARTTPPAVNATLLFSTVTDDASTPYVTFG